MDFSNICLSFSKVVFRYFSFFKRFFGSSEQLARFYMNVFNAEDLYFGHVPNMHYRLALYLTSVLSIKHATANYSVCVCTIQTHCVEFVI